MLRFVGVKKFWSCSNQNLVILIRSSELASIKTLQKEVIDKRSQHINQHCIQGVTDPQKQTKLNPKGVAIGLI